MKDYIEIEKIWQDDSLIELKVVCSSESITAMTKIYASNELIDNLIYQIKLFVDGKTKESNWANEERGNGSTTCVSFRFLHKDKLGHILVEVFLELNDGGDYDYHNCCFYVNTELGLLEEFSKKLYILKEPQLGKVIKLNQY